MVHGQEASLVPPCLTWGLSEANVLCWRKYSWHCWDFMVPPQSFSAPIVIWCTGNFAPLPPPGLSNTFDQKITFFKLSAGVHDIPAVWKNQVVIKNADIKKKFIIPFMTGETFTTAKYIYKIANCMFILCIFSGDDQTHTFQCTHYGYYAT